MKIITISGLDGSGKSTQIQLLKNYLESQGKRVFYFHAISFGLANKIIELKKYCLICRLLGKCKVDSNLEKSVTKANKLQIWLRKLFLRIDIGRFDKLCSKLEKEGYNYLVSDRYFYDSLVNIAYLKENNKCHSCGSRNPENYKVTGSSIKCGMTHDIINSDTSIYLQTSPENIMQHERKPDQGAEYLEMKKGIYDKYADIWKLKVIGGDRNKDEIFEEIKKYVS